MILFFVIFAGVETHLLTERGSLKKHDWLDRLIHTHYSFSQKLSCGDLDICSSWITQIQQSKL